MRTARPAIVAAALAIAIATSACAPVAGGGAVRASGTVRDDMLTVKAPYLSRASFDPKVGLPGTATPQPSPRAMPSGQPTLSAAVATVAVVLGQRVETGTVLARLDSRDLALGVVVARAAATRAHARIDVIDQRLSDLSSARSKLSGARSKLASTRVAVLAAIAQATAGRAKLLAAIAQLEPIVAKLPPLPKPIPFPGPDPRILLLQLKARLAKLDAGLVKAQAGLAKLDAAGAKLANARTKLADARALVRGARSLLREAAKAADAGVPVAEAKLAQTVLVAPASGDVVEVVQPGTVLMADAPAVRLRRAGPAVIDTYLRAADAARVRAGMAVDVSVDSLAGRTLAGTVTSVRAIYEYPPTSLPTDEIHMVRAYRVTVTLDDASVGLPAGTPADLVIHP